MDVNEETVRQAEIQAIHPANPPNLNQLIAKLASQSLQSSEKLFNLETFRLLTAQFHKIDDKNTIAHFLQQFVTTLLAYANQLKSQLSLNTSKQDYQILEKSIQKAEGEIRKHIKIEQQLKLYLDSLEERIQQLQYKLQLQQEKYLLLFESFKELDESHKKLVQQVAQSSEVKKLNQVEFKSIQMASNENMMSRKTKLGLKSRLIMEKLQQRTRKPNDHKRNQLLSITEDEVNLRGEPEPLIKKNSIERYRKQEQSQYSIKELTKSLHMKNDRSVESYNKKISKTKTETHQREGRSNSIMS